MRLLYVLFAVLVTAVSLRAQSYPSSFGLSSNSPVCNGQSFRINVNLPSAPAGTTLSFRWSGPNSFTSNAAYSLTVPASAATAGVYSVTMTFTGTSNGAVTASTTVSLGTSKPDARINYISPEGYSSYSHKYQICGPTSLSLIADLIGSNGATTYQWTGPNGFSSNQRNPVVSQGVAGLYILEAIYPNNCGTGRDTVTISNFNPSASISSYSTGQNRQFSTTFCPGSSVEFLGLTSVYPAGTTAAFQWSGPNGITSSAQNFTLTNLTTAMSGVYSLTVTFSGACPATATASWSIQVGTPVVGAYSGVVGGTVRSSFGTYCPGTDIKMDTYPANGVAYQWNGPNGFTSTAQSFTLTNLSPAMSGAYSVTMTVAGGCSNSAVANVAIGTPSLYVDSSTPESNPYYYTSSFCPGASARLSASVSGGTATYQWSGPNGFTSSAQSFTLTNLTSTMAGTYSVTATFSGACSGTVLTKTQTIQVGPPSVFAGSGAVDSNGTGNFNTFCPGTAFRVAASFSGSTATYQWRGPNGFTSSAQSFTLTNATAALSGAYSVTVTVSAGCSNTAVANVVVGTPSVYATSRTADANPVNASAFCLGSAFQIDASNSSGATATYQWRGPNGFTSTALSFTLTNATVAMTGTYSVTATYSGVCSGTATSSVYIRVGVNTPVVTASNTFIAPNQTVTLLASGCDSYNEQTIWSTGATGNTLIVTPAQNTTYSAVCRLTNGGCNGATSNVVSVTVTNAPPVDLRLSMQVSNRTPNVGDPVIVTVFLENRSNQDATNVQWQCRLPPALNWRGGQPTLSYANEVVTGNPTTVSANSILAFSFTISPVTRATYRMASQIIASDNPDPDATPNYGTNSGHKYVASADFRTPDAVPYWVVVSPEPNPAQLPPVASNQPAVAYGFSDLSLDIQTSTLTPTLNGEVTVTVRVTSRGYFFEEQAQVHCQLPPGVSFVSSIDFTASGNVLTSASRTVYSYNPTSLTFRARMNQPGQAIIRAEIFSAGRPDPDSTPNNGYDNGEDDTAQISLRTTVQ